MKRSVAAVAVAFTVGLTGCDGRSEAAPETSLPPSAEAPPAEPAPPEAALAEASAAPTATAEPAVVGAPAFAALYPEAAPEAVVAFYRQRAEAAGLAPVMAMNQGEARAYGAAARKENGATLQVVASPGEGGLTSVQLSWSAGV